MSFIYPDNSEAGFRRIRSYQVSKGMWIDVFNGDADGICALLQLRLQQPRESLRITGVKRDIALLERVKVSSGDHVTVLDISLAKNRSALRRLLAQGASVEYFDHHDPGELPEHPALNATISEAPEVCTALLVNGHLGGARVEWAIVGAFGDNLDEPAKRLAAKIGVAEPEIAFLRHLGHCINYNGYGADLEDLHFHPDALYAELYQAETPAAFGGSRSYSVLSDAYAADLAASAALQPVEEGDGYALYQLPNAAWARRVSGVFSNDLVRAHPDRAHAVRTGQGDGAFLVSVRAPFGHRYGASKVCTQFETGGGREAAAGINRLPAEHVKKLIAALAAEYGS